MALTKCKECNTEISTKADRCPKCGAKQKRWTIGRIIVWGFIGLLAIGFMRNVFLGPKGGVPSVAAAASPRDKVALKFSTSKGGFGSILMLDLTLTNNNAFAIKDIAIDCDGYASSGTKIDNNKKTLYESLEPGQTRSFDKFSMGFLHSQVSETRCGVQSVKQM
jgi:hypothetical protein